MKRTILIAAVVVVLWYLAAGAHFWRAYPVAAQEEPATAGVQRVLDEHGKTLANVVAALQRLDPENPATQTGTMLGLRPNDRSFDNGPLIQAALDKGYNVELDSTGLYYTSPLVTAAGQSCVIKGQGAGYRHNGKGVTGLAAIKDDQPFILELPGDSTKYNGQCQVIRDLYLLGNETCDGIRVHGCSNAAVENCVIRNCKRGYVVEPKIGVYTPSVSNSSILGCDIGIDIRNATTVCCFRADSVEIFGGRIGINLRGWKRGAVFTGCVVENQSELCLKMDDARLTLIGCYLENADRRAWLKNSQLLGIDTTCGNIAHNAASRVDWIGQNNRPYTVAYP